MRARYCTVSFLTKLTVAALLCIGAPSAIPAHDQVQPQAQVRSLSFTFDDGPDMTDTVRMTAAQRNAAILKQLADARLKSVLFIAHMDQNQQRIALVRQWGNEGHFIANHTVSHPDFNSPRTTLESFEQDMLACEEAIRTLPGYRRLFRFPYLNEGDTVAKRDGLRAFLKEKNYRTGHVSIDMSDWYYSERLRERLLKDPGADINPYREAYLRHVYAKAEYYDGLSQKVLHRSVLHVVLMHHNLLNALFLQDVIQMFRAKGWRVIDAGVAFEDPVYKSQPDILPAGESVLWALAKQQNVPGLRYPAEDEVYEKPILDRLGSVEDVLRREILSPAQ